jgi:Uma2 family endonuclease
MTRVVCEESAVRVPAWVVDLESFRRWSDDDAFPESGQISFLLGEVWIDMSKEQLFTHNEVKTAFTLVLAGLVRATRKGRYFSDGVFLSNAEADISNQPDGVYFAGDALTAGRVRIVEGRSEGHVEVEGSPDMVLEVVSRSSLEKDTVVLRASYARARIAEYWLVDARSDVPRFDILRLHRGAYRPVRKQGGWVPSQVFDQLFRLDREEADDGYPRFAVEVRGH